MARYDERVSELEALYAELPTIECMGLCGDACHFIGMTTLERERIRRTSGHDIKILDSPCPALDFMGRCATYQQRPMVCRLWGVVEGMECHYGCKPSPGYLTHEEGKVFLARCEIVSGAQSLTQPS